MGRWTVTDPLSIFNDCHWLPTAVILHNPKTHGMETALYHCAIPPPSPRFWWNLHFNNLDVDWKIVDRKTCKTATFAGMRDFCKFIDAGTRILLRLDLITWLTLEGANRTRAKSKKSFYKGTICTIQTLYGCYYLDLKTPHMKRRRLKSHKNYSWHR